MEKIDFVLPWLDDEDPHWKAEKGEWEQRASGLKSIAEDANGSFRYRGDSNMLRFWFRSVEAFAPWVNRIHFVTCGQKPNWLNECHPKLNLINHVDYIPLKYLPTFNANTIEMNFHRIPGLSERFVYFNDDMFLLQPIDASYFFRDGVPVQVNNLRYPIDIGYNNWSRLIFNDYCVVNKSFDINASIWENRKKWFSVSALGFKRARRNFICYWANRTLPVSSFGHVANPHLKSSLEEIWEKWPEVLDVSCSHKFRSDDQVNQWLAVAWNLAKGTFHTIHEKGRSLIVNISPKRIDEIDATIRQQKYPQICVNDSQFNTDPEKCSQVIHCAFESILPMKSSFEKE